MVTVRGVKKLSPVETLIVEAKLAAGKSIARATAEEMNILFIRVSKIWLKALTTY